MRFWFNKKLDSLQLPLPPESLTPPEVCKTCGCLIASGRGTTVEVRCLGMPIFRDHYCEGEGCKPPYEMVYAGPHNDPRYFNRVPARLARVTVTGEPYVANTPEKPKKGK